MKRPKYIPGDLVMTNGEPIGTKKGVAYIVTVSDSSRMLTLKDGTVNKGVVTLDAISEENKAHFVETSTWVKHIVPIPLTIDILKKNGYEQTRHAIDEDGMEWYEYENENNEFPEIQYYPKDDYSDEHFSAFWGGTEMFYDVRFVHQLQHLLFGLDIDVEFKI